MTPEAINIAIAKAVGFDLYVIIKRGVYYRPNAAGYTNCICEAWKLPYAEAKKHEMYADRGDIPGCEKVLIEMAPIPNYTTDLNAMQDAENRLLDADFSKFYSFVEGVYFDRTQGRSSKGMLSAPADIRAEAWLRAMNLWDDSK